MTTVANDKTAEGAMDSGQIHFPDGLLGFPDARDYRLAEGPGDGLFWLLGGESGGPSFLLSDPFVYFDGYTLDLTPTQAEQIQAEAMGEVGVLAITVPGQGGEPWTANLLGPVVINVEKRLGAQLVLSSPSPSLRRPFRPTLPGEEQKKAG